MRARCEQFGGLAEAAAHTPGDTAPAAAAEAGPAAFNDYDIYNLNDTLRGDGPSNPYVQPGDVITIPEAEQVFVVGNVFKPTALPLKEPLTVSQAIAMAGGALPDTKTRQIRIIRKVSGAASKVEIFVDLPEIVKQRAADVALQAGDIVEVPVSGGKRLMRNIYSALGPAFGNLPIYILR